MKLLIATPAYDGLITTKFILSLLRSIEEFRAKKVMVGFYTIDSDSLITRARNKCAQFALENGVDKLMFIDADINWEHWQIEELLKSDKPVIGGTYPLKHFPIRVNFNPLLEHSDMFSKDRTYQAFRRYAEKYADEKGEIQVRHLPTGFMLIDCSVFRKLQGKVGTYSFESAAVGKREYYHDYFPVRINGGNYETEDWGFCSQCTDAGIPIYLQTKVIVNHIGKHEYTTHES